MGEVTMKQLIKLFRKIQRDESGAVLIWFTVGILVFFGFAALAVDGSLLFNARGKLQATADGASLAGASQIPDAAAVVSEATRIAQVNMPTERYGTVLLDADVTMGFWDTATRTYTTPTPSPGGTTNAVRVVTKQASSNGNAVGLVFANVFGQSLANVSTSAVAVVGGNDNLCVLALEPSEAGISVLSNSTIEAGQCELQSNSCNALEAVEAESGSFVNAGETCACGGFEETSGSMFTPTPVNCSAITNPFADIPEPAVGPCDHNDFSLSSSTEPVFPGVYCGGLSIESGSTVTFLPGDYIITDGPLNIASNSAVDGTDVLFFVTGANAVIDINSNTTASFTGRQSGPREGFLFWVAEGANPDDISFIRSGSPSVLDGAMYFPDQNLFVESGSPLTATGPIVSLTMTVQSNTFLTIDSELGSTQNPLAANLSLRLVD